MAKDDAHESRAVWFHGEMLFEVEGKTFIFPDTVTREMLAEVIVLALKEREERDKRDAERRERESH